MNQSERLPSLSSIATVDDCESILCLVTQNAFGIEFYQFDPNPSVPTPLKRKRGVFARSLLQTPTEMPYGFSSVAQESTVYFVGGLDVPTDPNLIASAPSSQVSVMDGVLKPGVRTLGGKFMPLLTSVGGKIYAFGKSYINRGIDPWAEVFDPISNQWDGLPYPPDDVITGCVYTGGAFAAYHEKKNRIILSYDKDCLCYFDINSQSWGFYDNDDGFYDNDDEKDDDEKDAGEEEGPNITFIGRPAVVEDTLYVFSITERHTQLYAYDLEGDDKKKGFYPVKGLEEATKGIDISYTDYWNEPWNDPGFLFHLGNQKICLVWTEDLTTITRPLTRIHCLKFRVNKTESGELAATAENCDHYFMHNVKIILDCFLMKPTSRSDTTSLAKAAVPCTFPGVQQRVSLADDSLQGTRHVRRLYVDGFSAVPISQEIKEFFNTNTKGQNSSVSVVNIYINEQKKFAIVEMNSEENASEALRLDGSSFQNSTLRIRRPSDYTYWMDRTHSSGSKHVMENGLHSSNNDTKMRVKAKKKARSMNGRAHKSKKKRENCKARSANGAEHEKKKRKVHNVLGVKKSEHKRKRKRKIRRVAPGTLSSV